MALTLTACPDPSPPAGGVATATTRGHDPMCHYLAVHFLGALRPEAMKHSLAEHIQDAIEDWLRAHENAPVPVLSPGDPGAAGGIAP